MPAPACDRAAWQALIRRPSEWQHLFGPVESPITIAGTSGPILSLVTALNTLREHSSASRVIVEGGLGSGKSLAASAFQASCLSSGVDAVFVHEGTKGELKVPRGAHAGALIVDNLDRLSPGMRATVFRIPATTGGVLITAARLNAVERESLGSSDSLHHIGSWDERREDALIMASLAWGDVGRGTELADLCADGVAEELCLGPWPRGAHSIRETVTNLVEALELEGYFERALRPIEVGDVRGALLAVVRRGQHPEEPDAVHIVVEGSTDATYLETAGRLATEAWESDLLSGCRVLAPGEVRQGGANRALQEVIRLEALGVTAIMLLDDDDAGRSARDVAKKLGGTRFYLLPAEFDALRRPAGRGATEIEDLLPIKLLEEFYAENSDCEPEERTTRGGLTRIVVAGADKDRVANWVCDRASFEDMRKLVYVICNLREHVGLPLPAASPALPNWLKELSQ